MNAQKKKNREPFVLILVALFLVLGTVLGTLFLLRVNTLKKPYEYDYTWADEYPLIAHAFGGIKDERGNHTYTNSLEAFEMNYAKGHRVFEVDFDLTEDYAMIASHDEEFWRTKVGFNDEVPYTLEHFLRVPLFDSYTSMDIRGVVNLMKEYPDIYIVTDSKHTDEISVTLQFSQLVLCAREICPEALNRIIPQIYHEQMLDWVMSVYPFRSIIFTLYQTEWTPESVYNFCANSGVRFITMWDYLVTPEILDLWHQIGIKTAVHTVNDLEASQNFYDMGVNVVYTDYLIPSELDG